MAASKKIHCVICNKKCSGNVLRYQDQYYHKQCFELEQSQGSSKRLSSSTNSSNNQSRLTTGSELEKPFDNYDRHIASNTEPKNLDLHLQRHNKTTSSLSNNSTSVHYLNSSMREQQQELNDAQDILASPVVGATKKTTNQEQQIRSQTMDNRQQQVRAHNILNDRSNIYPTPAARSATLPHSTSVPANGFLPESPSRHLTNCAGCNEKIKDGQALIALGRHWHVWCFKCTQCQAPLHAEYVAKDGRAYCEKDYQKLYGVNCVYCKRYITGKVLQAGEAHHFHPSCARCSKCGDPFVPGEEMYLQGEVTWHPRCGPQPGDNNSVLPLDEHDGVTSRHSQQLRSSIAHSPSLSSRSQSRSASPFSFLSRQYGHSSPGYTDSEAVGDLSRIYTISYLNADPAQVYLRRPIEPAPPKSPQFSRPTSLSREPINSVSSIRSRSSSRSQYNQSSTLTRDRSVPRGMYSVLSGSGRSTLRARSPCMMNEEAIQLASYPSGQKPSPDAVPKIERDDFPAPPFPYPQARANSTITSDKGGSQQRERSSTAASAQSQESQPKPQQSLPQDRKSRPKSREIIVPEVDDDDDDSSADDPQLKKEEQELSKIANGIGKIFLQTLREREKLRAWKRANLDPRNASRTPSATREIPSRPLRYENPANASPSRDIDRVKPWTEPSELEHGLNEEQQLTSETGAGMHSSSPVSRIMSSKVGSSLTSPVSQMSPSTYGYKVVQANRSTPKPGYGLSSNGTNFPQHQYSLNGQQQQSPLPPPNGRTVSNNQINQTGTGNSTINNKSTTLLSSEFGRPRPLSSSSAHLRRSMPNVSTHHQIHLEGPPKLYPYHLLATSNYRLPRDVDRCHLERHLSDDQFQYIFRCSRLDFYRLPEWKRNELKRYAKLF